MNNILEEAASRLSVDVDSLVAGGLARGRRLRRRRQVVAGAGSVAAVAVLGVGGVVVAQTFGSSPTAMMPADSTAPVVSPAPPTSTGDMSPIPPSVLGPSEDYTADPDTSIAMSNAQIHAQLAALLGGDVGPIMTDVDHGPVDQGPRRIQFFLFQGTETSLIIEPAKGLATCASLVSHATPNAGYGPCETVGDATVLTSQETMPGNWHYNSVTAWRHGYEISVSTSNVAPGNTANPALDGKKEQLVSDQVPLSMDQLTQVATNNAWFR